MARTPAVVDYSQVKKAVKLPKGDTTRVKISNTGPRKYKTVLTPAKAAANKAAGGNSNVGKKITYSSGTTVDYTQVQRVKPGTTGRNRTPYVSANQAAGRVVKPKKSMGVTPGKRSKKGM